MDKLRNLKLPNKMSSAFTNLKKNKLLLGIIILVFVLIIMGILFAVYMYFLDQELLDITYHSSGVNLKSKELLNIPADTLPTITTSEYSLHTWFAIDKSHYTNQLNIPYSHLIGYGHLRVGSQTIDTLAVGVWIDNKSNNLFIV